MINRELIPPIIRTICLIILVASSTAGQTPIDIQPRATFVIRNARIVTVSGPVIDNGVVVIRDGKIDSVGANTNVTNVPSGAQEIDARGLVVYPGMIDLGTSIGLNEIGSVGATVDSNEIGEFNPNARVAVALNPYSSHIRVTRFNGVTNALSLPGGGIISGQAAFVNLWGTAPSEMAVIPGAALVIDYPKLSASRGFAFGPAPPVNLAQAKKTRDEQVDRLRKILLDASAYTKAQKAYAADNKLPRPERNVVLDGLVPYLDGTRPVIFRVTRAADIKSALDFAQELKLSPVILGGNEAFKLIDLIKSRKVPVIFTGTWDLPRLEDDAYDSLYETPAQLAKAGAQFCISTGDGGAQVRDLPYHAGMAAAYGLAHDEALKA
ncbi:MAG: hypothetical protein ACRD4L_05860, partial [Pyrinomonadaceae bacterium]